MKRELLRTEIARGIKQGFGVDREKGVIRGFAVMTKGFVNDARGWEIDETTLDQVIQAGNHLTIGLKSRFGHPMMSSEALGTFLGRVRNFGKEGEVVRAEEHTSELQSQFHLVCRLLLEKKKKILKSRHKTSKHFQLPVLKLTDLLC